MKEKCPYCEELSPLDDHLYELSVACDYFERSKHFEFSSIGSWLRIAALLEGVNISSEKYAGLDLLYCRPAADAYHAESKYFSLYSTALTRFLFTCNALEETYKLVSPNYTPTTKELKSNREASDSKKCLILFEEMEDTYLPVDFHHHCKNLSARFDIYKTEYNPQISIIKEYPKNHKCYALHVIRNLRNFLAHGTIPINLIPEYYGETEMWHTLYGLLLVANRVSALYIQALLLKYSLGFNMELYLSSMDYDYYIERLDEILEEYPHHVKISSPDSKSVLLRELHLKSGFGALKIANCNS